MSAVPRKTTNSLRTVPLIEVASLVRGVSYPKTDAREEASPGYVPVLRATNIQDARLILDANLVFIAERNVSQEQRLRSGDIVMATSSGSKHLVGKSAHFSGNWDGSFGAFCATIRPKSNIEPRYLAYFLQSPLYWTQVTKKAVGVNINNLRRGDLETLILPFPPLDQQRTIVAEIEKQFSRLDQGVAGLMGFQIKLKRYMAAVLMAAVEDRLIPSNGGVKATWTRCALGEVSHVSGGLTKNPKRVALARRLPYLRVANVYANELRLDEIEQIGVADSELQKLSLMAGDLLVVEGNGSKDQIGRLAIWDGSIDPCVHQNHLIKVRVSERVLPKWVLFWLLSRRGRRHIEEVSSSTSGLYTLSVNKVAALPIALPPLEMQKCIVAEVESRLSLIEGLEADSIRGLRHASTLRKAILSRAFVEGTYQ